MRGTAVDEGIRLQGNKDGNGDGTSDLVRRRTSAGSSAPLGSRSDNDYRRRMSMSVNRGYAARDAGHSWEMKLGALHAVIWVGLAVGAMVGAYFVGFFSGRYVGFETARSASGVEVAKLSITEDIPARRAESVSDIYNKLNAPATMEQQDFSASGIGKKPAETGKAGIPTSSGSGGGGTAVGGSGPKGGDSNAARIAQEVRAGTSKNTLAGVEAADGPSRTKAKPAKNNDGAVAASEIDAIFDDANNSQLPDDRAAAALDGGNLDVSPNDWVTAPQKGVRVLGGAGKDEGSPDSEKANSDKTLGAILEERVAKAREVNDAPAALNAKAASSKDSSGGKEKASERTVPEKNSKEESAKQTKGSSVLASPKTDQPSRLSGTDRSTNSASSMTDQKKPDQKKMPEATEPKQVIPQGYFAQVAAPKKMAEAQDVARRLRRSGFPVVVETAQVRGEDYFRVLVGPEENKVQADRLVDQLKRESYLSGSAFLRRNK